MAAFAFIPGDTTQWMAVLIDAAAKGLVVLLLAGGATLLLRRSSAAVRHMTWTLSIAALILVPFLSLALPQLHVPLLPDWAGTGGPARTEQTVPSPLAMPAQPPAVGESGVGTGGPGAESIMPAGDWPSPAGAPQPVHPADAAPETPAAPVPAAAAPQTPPVHWSAWVLLAWLAGAAALLLPLLAGTIIVWRQARRAERISSGSWVHLLDELRPQLGIRSRVVLLRSNWPNIPLTCGVFRPAIILPAEADEWPADRRRVVLLHELAHIRRRDCLTQLLARLARVIYWFNPLIWLAGRMLRIEREQACDDLVLASGHKASDYASHLLEIVRSLHSVRCPSLAAVAMARKSQFEGRLLAILDPRRNRRSLTRLGILIALVLVAAVAVPLAVLKATGPEKPLAAKADKPARKVPAFVVFINNKRYGPTNGSSLVPQEGGVTEETGKSTCGHPGAVSEVEWKYLRTTDAGDEYEVIRRFPTDTATPSTEKKTVVYRGKPLTVFEDEVQRVLFLSREDLEKIRQDAANAPASQSNLQPASIQVNGPPWKVRLPNGAVVELIGLADSPSVGKAWWGPDGQPLAERPYLPQSVPFGGRTWPDRKAVEVAYRVRFPDAQEQATFFSTPENRGMALVVPVSARREPIYTIKAEAVLFRKGQETTNIRIGAAGGPWKPVARGTFDANGTVQGFKPVDAPGSIELMAPPEDAKEGAFFSAVMDLSWDNVNWRFVAHDDLGMAHRLHEGRVRDIREEGKPLRRRYDFVAEPPTKAKLVSLRLDVRPLHYAEFQNVTLLPGKKAALRVVTGVRGEASATQPASKPSIGVYLITARPKDVPFEKVPLADFTLADEPLIRESDVLEYDWESHTIRLKQQDIAYRVLSRRGDGDADAFVVVANGRRLYAGVMTSILSGFIEKTPVIFVSTKSSELQPKGAIRIYSPRTTGTPDPRSDARLKEALQALHLLSRPEAATGEPATQPASLPGAEPPPGDLPREAADLGRAAFAAMGNMDREAILNLAKGDIEWTSLESMLLGIAAKSLRLQDAYVDGNQALLVSKPARVNSRASEPVVVYLKAGLTAKGWAIASWHAAERGDDAVVGKFVREHPRAKRVYEAPPLTAPPGGRMFPLYVVDDNTGEALAQAGAITTVDGEEYTLISDANGLIRVPLGAKRPPNWPFYNPRLTMNVRLRGYLPVLLKMDQDLPDQFTLRLPPGKTIGGTILDEQGRPVANASIGVWPAFEEPAPPVYALHYCRAFTDQKGQWLVDGVPDNTSAVFFRLEHPDYVIDRHWHGAGPMEGLYDKTNVMVLEKSDITVSGVVVGADGKPLAGATIWQGKDRLGAQYPTARTDAAGRYVFPQTPAGRLVLFATAPGCCPQLMEVTAEKGMEPLNFNLSKGNTICGIVLGPDGKPVEGVLVSVETWHGKQTLNWSQRTDAAGRFEWTEAPSGAVRMKFSGVKDTPDKVTEMGPSEQSQTIRLDEAPAPGGF